MIIREATPDDITPILDFLLRVAPASGRMHAPPDVAKSGREIARVVTDRHYGYALLACDGARIVGTLGVIHVDWWYSAEKFFAERWFFVDPDAGARGIGAALVHEADLIAREVGAPLILDLRHKRKQSSAVIYVQQRMNS